MFGQDFTCPALLEDTKRFLPVRGCHPLWPDFPDGSGSYVSATGLVRVRSPLLTESRLMSFPPGTEMFQFPGFASAAYGFSGGYLLAEWVAPFGDPRIKACSRLPKAFRSVPRPSSPLGAKASTRCPCFPRPPPATTADHPTRSAIARGPRPVGAPRRQDGRRRSGHAAEADSSDYHKAGCPPVALRRHGAKHTHARCAPCPQTERPREGQERATCRCPPHARRTSPWIAPRPCPRNGHLITTSRCPKNSIQPTPALERARRPASGVPFRDGRATAQATMAAAPPSRSSGAWWAWADLNGRPHAYQACALTS